MGDGYGVNYAATCDDVHHGLYNRTVCFTYRYTCMVAYLHGIPFLRCRILLSLLTGIPFKRLLPLQLLVTGLLVMEKALVFLVFTMKGATANVSFLSFGPLAITFLDNSYFHPIPEPIDMTTAIIVVLQYRFISTYRSGLDRKRLFWLLFGIHIVMALIVAGIGFIPMESLFHSIVERGVGHE